MQPFGSTGNLCLNASLRRFASFFALIGLLAFPWRIGRGQTESPRRPITVRDTIEMTEFADRGYFLGGAPESPVALFSPNGKQFLIRLKKGDVRHNLVQYTLLLYRTREAFNSPRGRLLVTMSSSSDREAIQQVRWLDNKTVSFLGEMPSGVPQVYSVDVTTRRRRQLTHHSSPVVSYDIAHGGEEIVYEAAPSQNHFLETEEVRRHGVRITADSIDGLLEECQERSDPRIDRELFIKRRGKKPVRVASPDFLTEYLPLRLSPDGRFAVLAAYVGQIPAEWQVYEDKVLHRYIVEPRKPGTLSNVEQYMLLDLRRAKLTPLIDAPKAWLDEGIAWAADGKSVIVSGTYLPLGHADSKEFMDRKTKSFVIEVEIPSLKFRAIAGGRLQIENWDDANQKLSLEPGYGAQDGANEAFTKIGGQWKRIPFSAARQRAPVEITLEEDINTPPKIFVASPDNREKRLLLDLNPQFHSFDFATVETIEWKATDGHAVRGGLYLPPGYQPGHRYPLVIQSHGYDENRFWMNGPWNSAFAAQPLAAQGIMVLQVGDSVETGADRKHVNTPEEGPRRMAAFEGAIDELDHRGLIDRDLVGIIGFSRTVFHVAFTLTHSKYSFRAATMADGFEGGYLNYLLWRTADYEGVNGGSPVGSGLHQWIENSPGFQIEEVSTPVRLEYYGPAAFLGGWQWYSQLSSLGKPVDFLWLPRGTHLLVKPWERLASQQGNVDWFRFWLSGSNSCGQNAESSGVCTMVQTSKAASRASLEKILP